MPWWSWFVIVYSVVALATAARLFFHFGYGYPWKKNLWFAVLNGVTWPLLAVVAFYDEVWR